MKPYNYDEQYYETGIGGFHRDSFPKISTAFRESVAPGLEKGSVLDFGCGNGFYGKFLSSKVAYVDGVDFSPVLGTGRNRQYYRNFSQADLGQPWTNGKIYDALISIECIEHVQDYRQFLANAYSALKPGGTLFLTTTTYFCFLFIMLIVYRRQTSFASLSEFLRGLAGNETARTAFIKRFWEYTTGHYHGFTKGQLRRGAEAAGFVVERLDYLHVQNVFPVHYLDHPYEKKYKWLVRPAATCLKILGRTINWACRRFDLNAQNVLLVARKPAKN
jgi:2-polyprenyl-3-methyl-5-hydroxy-6-metoxy-1,4-benzoquinol methylase